MPLNRTERVLVFMIAGILVLSVVTIVVVTILTATGAAPGGGAFWESVQLLPLVGLPLAFVLIIVFLVLSTLRRRRIAEGGRD